MSTSPVHGSTGSANNKIQPKRRIAPGEQSQPNIQAIDFNNSDHLRAALANKQNPLETVAFNFIWETDSPEVVRQVAETIKTLYGDVDKFTFKDTQFTLLHLLLSRKENPPSPELVQALMDVGSDPNKRNSQGLTVFDRLDSSNHPSDVKKQIETILTKGGAIKAERFSAFTWAAHQIEKYFFPSPPNHSTQQPNAPTQNGSQQPLAPSATSHNTEPQITKATTPAEPPITATINRQTPLWKLADNFNAIKSLVEQPEIEVRIPILAAAIISHTNTPAIVQFIAEKLITERQNIDFPVFGAGIYDNTMLHNLVSRGKPELVKILIKMGANPYTPNKEGETAFNWLSKIEAKTPEQTTELQNEIRAILENKPQTQQNAASQQQPQIQELVPINPLSTLKSYVAQTLASAYAELPELPSFSDLMPPILMNPLMNALTTHNPLMAGLPQSQSGSQVENTEHEYKEIGVQTDPLPEDPRIQQQAEELASLRSQTAQLSTQAKKLEEKLAKSRQTQEAQLTESAAEKATLAEKNRQLRDDLTKFKKDAVKEQAKLEAQIQAAKAQNKTLETKLRETTQSSQAQVSQLETEKQSLHEKLNQAEQTVQKTLEENEKALQHSKRQQQQHTSHISRLKQENAQLSKALEAEKTRQTEQMAQLKRELEAAQKERKELQGELSKAKMSAATHLITHAQVQQAQIDAKKLREKLEKAQTDAATQQQQSAQHIEALTQAQVKTAQEMAEAQAAIQTLRAQLAQTQQEAGQHWHHAAESEQRAQALQIELAVARETAARELQEAQQAYADMVLQLQQALTSADRTTLAHAQAANGIIISLGEQLEKALKALGVPDEKFPLLAEVNLQAGLPDDQQTEQEGQPRYFVPFPRTRQPIEGIHPHLNPVPAPFNLGTVYMRRQEVHQDANAGLENGEMSGREASQAEDDAEQEPSTSRAPNPQAAAERKSKEAPFRLENTGHTPPMLSTERRSQSFKHFNILQA